MDTTERLNKNKTTTDLLTLKAGGGNTDPNSLPSFSIHSISLRMYACALCAQAAHGPSGSRLPGGWGCRVERAGQVGGVVEKGACPGRGGAERQRSLVAPVRSRRVEIQAAPRNTVARGECSRAQGKGRRAPRGPAPGTGTPDCRPGRQARDEAASVSPSGVLGSRKKAAVWRLGSLLADCDCKREKARGGAA